MADQPKQISQPPRVPISEDTARQLLANQAQELVLRGQELELRKTELTSNQKFAESALEAQAQDRKDDREQRRKSARERYIFAGAVILVVVAFASYALHLNKDAIVIELLKIIGPLAVGGFGGYYIGKNKAAQQRGSDTPPEA